METRPSSKQTAVQLERATAAVGGPWKAARIPRPGRGTSWVALDGELRERSSHESCLA